MSKRAGRIKSRGLTRGEKISRSLRKYYRNKRATDQFFKSWIEYTYNRSYDELTHNWKEDKFKRFRSLWREYNSKLRKDKHISFKDYIEKINYKSYDQIVKRWGIKKYTEERRLAFDSVAIFKYVKSKNLWQDTRTGKLYPRKVMAKMFKEIRRERMIEEIIYKEYQKTGRRIKRKIAVKILEKSLDKEGWFRTLWRLIKKSP